VATYPIEHFDKPVTTLLWGNILLNSDEVRDLIVILIGNGGDGELIPEWRSIRTIVKYLRPDELVCINGTPDFVRRFVIGSLSLQEPTVLAHDPSLGYPVSFSKPSLA